VTDALLAVRDLSAGYGPVTALRQVSLEVAAGEAVAVIGANGAGKTTLLHAIAGLLRPSGGSIELTGQQCAGQPAERMVRMGVNLVPEGRHVFAGLSVDDNLLLGAYARRRRGKVRARASASEPVGGDLTDDMEVIYELFPQLATRRRQPAGTLSGGEQQMLAIGRGLMSHPRVLLLDEPSLGLAPIIVGQVVEQLIALRRRGTTILLVEQNARAAFRVASRAYVLQQGEVVVVGSVQALEEDPRVRAAYLTGA
jgi:branched-chain amino acid transport system ATP-binding protein